MRSWLLQAIPMALLTFDCLLHATGCIANWEKVLKESWWRRPGTIQNQISIGLYILSTLGIRQGIALVTLNGITCNSSDLWINLITKFHVFPYPCRPMWPRRWKPRSVLHLTPFLGWKFILSTISWSKTWLHGVWQAFVSHISAFSPLSIFSLSISI